MTDTTNTTAETTASHPVTESPIPGIEPLTEEEMLAILTAMAGDNGGQVQDIWYKSKRVIRTVAQASVGFIVAAPTVVQITAAVGADPSSHLGVTLAAIGTGATAVAGVLSRIMSVPAVNAWLVNIGMGSVPKSTLISLPDLYKGQTTDDIDDSDDEPRHAA
ncbi:hypothetical protein [Bifidobacterium catulorum]|uniref:Holin n=1 Tax=Bifidobacterium catulorum TaxID=1630173 RepID=A0A2U2MUM0_9BIFI|nr:hypothetical protein [Bifidobacterium catulorum]PWG60514.1 hypothetical protein DF200_02665 [Bifidobacterium catulorum]